MVRCAIYGCTNYQGKRTAKYTKFFCFPKDTGVCNEWVAACGQGVHLNFNIARICSEHFTESDYRLQHILLKTSDENRRLKHGAVPTLNLPKAEQKRDPPQNKDEEELSVVYQVEDGSPKQLEEEAETIIEIEVEILDESENSPNEQSPRLVVEEHCEPASPITESSGFSRGIHKLRQENKELRRDASELLERVRKAESVGTNLRRFFTKGQIKRLQNPKKKGKWSSEVFSNSLSLFTASPVVYQMLCEKNYPLPSPATLRKWSCMLKLRPGFIDSSLKALSASKYNNTDRLCVLAFLEIRLKAPLRGSNPSGMRPYKFAQVFMLRGLVNEWKQVVYYNFDCMMPGLVVRNIIGSLKDIDFTVVAVVSGAGPRKLAIWKELGIDESHPSFEVLEGEKVFYFANVPHLIKRLRNHFLTSGFLLNNTTINADPLVEMLAAQSHQHGISHNLTKTHLSPSRVGRHNLQIALQLFSRSVAAALRELVTIGQVHAPFALHCSNFVEVVSDWFAMFNSKYMTQEGGYGPMAYGLALLEQNSIIVSMNDIAKSLKVVNATGEDLLPFQRGILLNNCSMPLLYEYLKEKHNLAYVLTNNLNPDDLEHSFGIRKSHKGIADQPTPLEFKYRLRAAILVNLNVQEGT